MSYSDSQYLVVSTAGEKRTAANGPKKIGIDPRKVTNASADAKIFHGTSATPRTQQRTCPLTIVMYLGMIPVKSAPKAIVLVPIFDPIADK